MFVSKKNKLPAAIINPRLKEWWAAVCHVCPQCSRDKPVLSENARNQKTKAFILEGKIKAIVAGVPASGAASLPECCRLLGGHGSGCCSSVSRCVWIC